MNCAKCLSVLEPPLKTVCGAMSIVTSIVATTGNGFVLLVTWKAGFKIVLFTKILTSFVANVRDHSFITITMREHSQTSRAFE